MKTFAILLAVLTFSILWPLNGSATDTDANAVTDNIENLRAVDVDDPTTAFINLDEAREIADMIANDELTEKIIDYASRYLGTPYRRGARGPKAFDCSGFTSYVFRNFDIELSPSSSAQFLQGERITASEIQPGDLLFFSGRSGGKSVGHVAMAVDVESDGTVKFIHAANRGGIRHDTYPDGGYYSKRFLGARRVLN